MSRTLPLPPQTPVLDLHALRAVEPELNLHGFTVDEHGGTWCVFRDGERYILFQIEHAQGDEGVVRLGVGSHFGPQGSVNSMLLEELVQMQYGGLKRGRYELGSGGRDFLIKAMADIKEFAYDFLTGDFRPFLRMLSLKHREDTTRNQPFLS